MLMVVVVIVMIAGIIIKVIITVSSWMQQKVVEFPPAQSWAAEAAISMHLPGKLVAGR